MGYLLASLLPPKDLRCAAHRAAEDLLSVPKKNRNGQRHAETGAVELTVLDEELEEPSISWALLRNSWRIS